MGQKGDSIRFKSGSYRGRTGWLDADKGSTERQVYVCVDMGNKEFWTRVSKESIAPPYEQPSTFEEAALQQHPEIERMMDKLVRDLARCGINGGSAEIAKIFDRKLHLANAKQAEKGSKATYWHVEYPNTTGG